MRRQKDERVAGALHVLGIPEEVWKKIGSRYRKEILEAIEERDYQKARRIGGVRVVNVLYDFKTARGKRRK